LKFNPRSFKSTSEVQQEVLRLIPACAHTADLRNFAAENQLSFSEDSEPTYLEFLRSAHPSDIQYDKVVICCTKLMPELWPWRLISFFSNGWLWMIKFYLFKDELMEVSVEWASNGL